MPVKRRISKRRRDPQAEYTIWESVFDCGYDFFGELGDIGIASDAYGRPDEFAAEAAWQRYGARYLSERSRKTPSGAILWALEQFGEPAHAC